VSTVGVQTGLEEVEEQTAEEMTPDE